MTIEDAYKRALSLDSSLPSQDDSLEDHAVNLTNMWLLETLPAENAVRYQGQMKMLASAPTLTKMSDTVPYSTGINSGLPYWIASFLMKDGGDNVWANRYYEMYLNATSNNTPLMEVPPVDVWRCG